MSGTAEVSIDVNAPAVRVYEMVSDLPRMGEWSPECVRCVWRGGATVAAPGAKFKGYNRLGWRRWSTQGTVVSAEPGRELAWDVRAARFPIARWTYRIEETGPSSCRVTELWEDHRSGFSTWLGTVASGVPNRGEHNTAGMQATLERIKAEAEGA